MKKDEENFSQNKRIQYIACKYLSVIWAEAQRPLDMKHAQAIADNLDPDMFGTLAVTKPNGKGIYHLIDGHHRKTAVELAWGPDQKVPCEIFEATDPARAAKLFDKINSARKKPQAIDLFKVRVAAGDDAEVAVNKIVHANGLIVAASHHNNAIACVDALLVVYRGQGAQILSRTLQQLRLTFGPDQHALNSHLVRGYALFLTEFRHADLDRLRAVIAKRFTPGRLLGTAKTAREVQGGTTHAVLKDLLFANYNKGLRGSGQLRSKVTEE